MGKLNDYELLYQIANNDTYAYELMIEKYKLFIFCKIKSFHVLEKEEFFQEGLIVLNTAINTFKDEYNKTFTRYFEKLLVNKFINLKKKERIEYSFDEDFYMQKEYILEEVIYEYETKALCSSFDELERNIYIDYFLEKGSVEYISQKYHLSTQKTYYYIRQIKNKSNKKSSD